MTITACNEVWRGESFSDTVEGGQREYTTVYQIISDDPAEQPSAVRAALAAVTGGSYPDDAAAYPTKRSARRSDESRLVWEGEVNWEYKLADPSEPPLDRDPKIRWTSSLVSRVITQDINGNAVLNSAGDYFDPPIEAEFPRATATIQFNAAAVPVDTLAYMGAVNNAAVTIDGLAIAAERARVIGLDIGEEDEENDEAFRSVTVVVECRDATDEGWDKAELDQGFRIRDTVEVAGTLSARTGDSVGTLTITGHGISTGQGVDVYWNSGSNARIGCVAGTVSGDNIPITSGAGDVLPASSTSVFIITGGLKDILIEDEDGNRQRPSAPVLLDGIGGKLENPNLSRAKYRPFVITRKVDLTVFPGIV